MAHVTCLAAARNAVLRARGWDVERQGLGGAPAIRILANSHRHGSLERAVRFLGLGTDALVPLATGTDARVSPATLLAELSDSEAPTIVALDAADLNIGAMDPFADLIPMARAAGAWVHIDGAFGLWARASARHREKTSGIELAHSWATDAHKWLNTPKDIGIAIVTDREAHRASMNVTAAYVRSDGLVRDPMDWTPDWSRRARGFPVYAALRELGRNGVEALIDRCCDHAHALAAAIGALDGVDLIALPTLNQGLVRFLDPTPGSLRLQSRPLHGSDDRCDQRRRHGFLHRRRVARTTGDAHQRGQLADHGRGRSPDHRGRRKDSRGSPVTLWIELQIPGRTRTAGSISLA